MSYNKRKGNPLKGYLEYRAPPELTSDAIESFLSSLDCPRSLAVWLLFRDGEHHQLLDLECRSDMYSSVSEFRASYAATELLSKFKGLSLRLDTRTEALLKFEKFELKCRGTNLLFRNLECHPNFRGDTVRLHNAIVRKISRVLGEVNADEFFQSADWGPGASTLIKGKDACSPNKFQNESGITRRLYDFVFGPEKFFEVYYPRWFSVLSPSFPRFEPGNKVTTVPKNAKTDRVIAIEPGFNLWFQKAIGTMIRHRLRRNGVDLRWQSKNQEFAKVGSKDSSLATIDFSSASDSISIGVVRELIPPLWFELMDICRSHYQVSDDAKLVKWNKFSSMGNGFTFELESLIFYAVACCCVEDDLGDISQVTVYGDDVILPVASAEKFRRMSEFYGFTFNDSKSFLQGPFRESCGKHYHSGVDVTPLYLKDRVSTLPAIFRLANGVRRMSHVWNCYTSCDARFAPVFYRLVSRVPKALRLRIPATLGDGGFISNFDEAAPRCARHGHCGYDVRNLVSVSKPRAFEGVGLLLARLWLRRRPSDFFVTGLGILDQLVSPLVEVPLETGNTVSTRDHTEERLVNSRVLQWYDLGPWL